MSEHSKHTQRDERIRAIAHRIWEETGCATDQAKLHWEMAEEEVKESEGNVENLGHNPEKLPFLKTQPMA